MNQKNHFPFPYVYWDLSSEEKEEITKISKSLDIDLIRVGPRGYVLTTNYSKDAENMYNMPLRSEDIFVTTFPRSGTTWTQELVWLLANNLDYDAAAATTLLLRFPQLEFYTWFTEKWKTRFVKSIENNEDKENLLKIINRVCSPKTERLAAATSPRFLKSHLPLSLLPPRLLDTARVVYVARDPRDVAVSYYHFCKMYEPLSRFCGTFKDFWNLFIRDLVHLTPYFGHVKESWERRHHPNMLFLFYEDLSKDLPATVQRVAQFLNKVLITEEMDRLCNHLSFDNFKNNNSVNNEHAKEYGIYTSSGEFIRKGKAGGWCDYFDAEMTLQAERWIAHNLRDTDLRFPTM